MLAQHVGSKSLQHLFLGDVSNEMLALLLVNHIDYSSLRTELIGDAPANTVGTTSYYDYFIFKHISKGTLFSVTNANSPYK